MTLAEMLASAVEKQLNNPEFHARLATEIENIVRRVVRNEIEEVFYAAQRVSQRVRPEVP